MNEELDTMLSRMNDKDDFLSFCYKLKNDYQINHTEWENDTLLNYLEGLAGWVEDMEVYYANNSIPMPSDVPWSLFADMLIAAKTYS